MSAPVPPTPEPLTPKEIRELDRMRKEWAEVPDPGTIDMFGEEQADAL